MTGASAADYTGSAACTPCHKAQAETQAKSGHALALRRAAEHPLFKAFGLEAPVEWAFGAGDQAVTFVSRIDRDWYLEHRFSYYSASKSLELTPGHSQQDVPGVRYRTFDPSGAILRCFQCHSTGKLSLGAQQEIVPAEPGVRCESCHGPGSDHVRAAGKSSIHNPGQLAAAELNQFCGSCHRMPPSAGSETDWTNAWNTRHQPVYLSQSACFQKSEGTLSCLTCHNPHERLQRDALSYNAKCAACHGLQQRPPAKVCNANAGKACTSCHMPNVSPLPNLKFANHWIGVYRPGSNLRPVR
ncbi:MAG: multiheme c-type cytochrome [Bryobacteraceae bacterium]